jgi:hypothetical protein
MMTISEPSPKSRSPVWSLLSRPRLSSFPCCVHHATAAPVFTDTPARRSQEASAPTCIVNLSAAPNLARGARNKPDKKSLLKLESHMRKLALIVSTLCLSAMSAFAGASQGGVSRLYQTRCYPGVGCWPLGYEPPAWGYPLASPSAPPPFAHR